MSQTGLILSLSYMVESIPIGDIGDALVYSPHVKSIHIAMSIEVSLSSHCDSHRFPPIPNMPVSVEQIYSISFNQCVPWRVPTDCIKRVDDTDFVKCRAYDPGFVRLVCAGHVDIPKKSRPSLAQCDGWKELLKLRNDAAASSEAPEADVMEPKPKRSIAQMLFENAAPAAKKARKCPPKMNAARLQELRENPEVFEFEVPGFNSCPDMLITAIKPSHPCDELAIKCDEGTIEHVIEFLRASGLDRDCLLNKRQYGTGKGDGIWRNGSAGFVRKLKLGDGEGRRYQSHNNDGQESRRSEMTACAASDDEDDD